ncbi:MAG TPA: hypothetical protein PKB10_09540, partial [Tepidisphaeraceae bacterium]|nr:hypothetical protein [Tepidisphaeraceae bacterium]
SNPSRDNNVTIDPRAAGGATTRACPIVRVVGLLAVDILERVRAIVPTDHTPRARSDNARFSPAQRAAPALPGNVVISLAAAPAWGAVGAGENRAVGADCDTPAGAAIIDSCGVEARRART